MEASEVRPQWQRIGSALTITSYMETFLRDETEETRVPRVDVTVMYPNALSKDEARSHALLIHCCDICGIVNGQ